MRVESCSPKLFRTIDERSVEGGGTRKDAMLGINGKKETTTEQGYSVNGRCERHDSNHSSLQSLLYGIWIETVPMPSSHVKKQDTR